MYIQNYWCLLLFWNHMPLPVGGRRQHASPSNWTLGYQTWRQSHKEGGHESTYPMFFKWDEAQKEFPEARRLTSLALEAQKLQRDPGLKTDRNTTSTDIPQHTCSHIHIHTKTCWNLILCISYKQEMRWHPNGDWHVYNSSSKRSRHTCNTQTYIQEKHS